MKRLTILAVMACATLFASAQKNEQKVDTLVVTTNPKMRCEKCAKKIMLNVRFVKGTKNIQTSVPKQEVTIVYDTRKATLDDYKAAFAKLGFEIEAKM